MTRNKHHKKPYLWLLAALMFAAGLLVYLYPFIARSFGVQNCSETLETFRFTRAVYGEAEDAPIIGEDGSVSQTPAQKQAASLTWEERSWYSPADITGLREAMEEYNKKIFDERQTGLKDAWSYEDPEFDLTRYGITDNVIGELRIPAINCDLPLYLGATWENMAYGAVQLGQTSMPLGGKNTNCVIAAHRGCTNGDYFLYIHNLDIGDRVYIDNMWETLTYRVCEIRIISPSDRQSVLIQDGRDMVTLISCHPYPFNYQRYAVFCERIPNDSPDSAYVPPDVKIRSEFNYYTEEPQQSEYAEEQSEAASERAADTTYGGEISVSKPEKIDNSSDFFIRAEKILNYAVPAAIILLALLLLLIPAVRKKRVKNDAD